MRTFDRYEVSALIVVAGGMFLMGWIYSVTRELSWQICLVIATGILLISGIVFKEKLRGYFDPNYELLKIPEKTK